MEKCVWCALAKRKRDGQTNNRNKRGHSMGTEQCQCIKSIYCSANILFKINDINSIENRKQQWLVHWMHNITMVTVIATTTKKEHGPAWITAMGHTKMKTIKIAFYFDIYFLFIKIDCIDCLSLRLNMLISIRIDLIFFGRMNYIWNRGKSVHFFCCW